MNIAIYPRKSQAADNSQSMEQQIQDCKNYIEQHFKDYELFIYDGDYALSGYSTKKRLDFQRMMRDVKSGMIDVIVVYRYDRISRNMRDFCNLFHDIEEAGSILVSVSQQINTSTPYGKNFMYQMAAMAELEWSLISERYKDMIRYRASKGMVYTKDVPFGFKKIVDANGIKRVVHDSETEYIVYKAIDLYKRTNNIRKTVLTIRNEDYPGFSIGIFRNILHSPRYIGEALGFEDFCEPYLTREEQLSLRNTSVVKTTPSRRVYLFTGLIKCPYCGNSMAAKPTVIHGTNTVYKNYLCHRASQYKNHKPICVSETKIEKHLLNELDSYMESYKLEIEPKKEKVRKSSTKDKKALNGEIERLNYLFQKGRIKVDYYEKRYEELNAELNQVLIDIVPRNVPIIDLPDNWKEQYTLLDEEHKRNFWRQIIKEIIISEDRQVANVCFKN